MEPDRFSKLMVSRGPGTVRVSAPRDQVGRAMRILHALFVGAEARGWAVREKAGVIHGRPTATPVVTVDGYACEVRIGAVVRRVRRPENEDRWAPRYDDVPTGDLRILLVSVDPASAGWLDWIEAWADRIDPTLAPLITPSDPPLPPLRGV